MRAASRSRPDRRRWSWRGPQGARTVYVQSFPDAGRKTQISIGGGTEPNWRQDGREIFFRSSEDKLLAASIVVRDEQVVAGTPFVLFAMPATPSGTRGSAASYAPSRDGQRFLVNTIVDNASAVTVLLNWNSKN
jgi:hypothetical protein